MCTSCDVASLSARKRRGSSTTDWSSMRTALATSWVASASASSPDNVNVALPFLRKQISSCSGSRGIASRKQSWKRIWIIIFSLSLNSQNKLVNCCSVVLCGKLPTYKRTLIESPSSCCHNGTSGPSPCALMRCNANWRASHNSAWSTA